MSLHDRYRDNVARLLVQAEGAHYVHGAFGNHPGASNGHPARIRRLTMPQSNYGDRPVRNPAPPHVHAAFCASNHEVYCAGRPFRCDLPEVPREHRTTPQALRDFALHNPATSYRWPRPDSENAGQIVYGESCQNKRHFDCIGLVNWVIWSIFGTTTINNIAQCELAGQAQARAHPEIGQTIQPGDILVYSIGHIGIAYNQTQMVEAKGGHWGVVRSHLNTTSMSAKLRPTEELLRGRWNVRG